LITYDLRFALLNPDGSVVSDRLITNLMNSDGPRLVWSGTEYGLAWIRLENDSLPRELMFLRLDNKGAPIGSPVGVGTASNNPSLAWSDVYRGYAVASYCCSQTQLDFRRIGANGTNPDPVNAVSFVNVYKDIELRAAPDGTWAAASSADRYLDLTIFNADGSRTLPVQQLTTGGAAYAEWPALVHDGTTWLAAWVGGNSIVVNRGAAANSPATIAAASSDAITQVVGTMVNGTLALLWAEGSLGSYGPYRLRMQRFAIPPTTTSALTAVHNAVDVVPTASASVPNVAIVPMGSRLMVLWVDGSEPRSAREVWAKPLDLNACP
jgi:hypothetical protein